MGVEKYIKILIEGLADGPQWIHKAEGQNGTLIHDRNLATKFDEQDAFTIRKNVIAQLPRSVKVGFDLKG